MDECCRVEEGPGRAPDKAKRCPRCGTLGKAVAPVTVRSILVPHALEGLDPEGEARVCPNPSCAVLYFDGQGWSADKDDARVRVGFKETEDPLPLCYCFGFSRGDIRAEIEATGRTTIPGRIEEGIDAGRCSCEVKNPKGACCLGDVAGAVKELNAAGSPAAAVATLGGV